MDVMAQYCGVILLLIMGDTNVAGCSNYDGFDKDVA